MMDSLFWERLHGGATHFPMVLVLVSALFESAAFLRGYRPNSGEFPASGRWLLLLGAAGAIAAVASGVALSHGVVGGAGGLGRHHLFVWPAFALIVGLAVWRLVIGNESSTRGFTVYLGSMAVACALIAAAGFYGGELLLGK